MMARRAEPAVEAGRGPVELLREAATPWTAAAREALTTALREGRLPHALLLHGADGAGQTGLAWWSAQLALCDRPQSAPCGRCSSCRLFLAGNHPDIRSITLEEKASFIKVEQVRELSAAMALTSYRGRRKVGIIAPADRMNTFSFNALLKTLEEPPPETLLILAASRLDRLPRTVVSRCQRIRIPNPPGAEAEAWLERIEPGPDWGLLLELAAGAPLKALDLAHAGVAALAGDMEAALGRRLADPLALALAWSRDRPAERLAWLEHWLAAGIRAGLTRGSDAINNNSDIPLPSGVGGVNITAAFRLLDRIREARALLETSLNTQLLFEDLLFGLAETLGARKGGRREYQG